jgi:SEC-C motif-containing protein
MTNTAPCACNSGKQYSSCCEPLISESSSASTAEALMRSRYVAFAVRNVRYLLRTWHPSTRPVSIAASSLPELYGLQIVRTEAGSETDDEGVVEFRAQRALKRKIKSIHEVSRFVKENGKWLYVGDALESAPAVSHKTGRNAPCPCGSGKKFKRCCGP